MKSRKTSRPNKRRRRRQSKAETFFGALVIEGLGIFLVIVMFVYARQASELPPSSVVEAESVQLLNQVSPAETSSKLSWRQPDVQRFNDAWNSVHQVVN